LEFRARVVVPKSIWVRGTPRAAKPRQSARSSIVDRRTIAFAPTSFRTTSCTPETPSASRRVVFSFSIPPVAQEAALRARMRLRHR
jgi:hypothetical protein